MAICATIKHLQQIIKLPEVDSHLKIVASHALAIIQDIDAEYMTNMDISALKTLVEEIYGNNQQLLINHLKDGSPDCAICAALVGLL